MAVPINTDYRVLMILALAYIMLVLFGIVILGSIHSIRQRRHKKDDR